MAKRRSEEARVLSYFRQQPIEKVELMLGLVKEEVKQRSASPAEGKLGQAAPKKRKARKPRAALGGTQTSFDMIDVAQPQ